MFENKFAVLGFGAVVAAGLVAAYIGLVPGKPTLDKPVAAVNETAQPQPVAPAPQLQSRQDRTRPGAGCKHAGVRTAPATSAPQGEAAEAKPGAPTFDILRVEPSGSIVIAGKAAKNATCRPFSRGAVIGTTKSIG